MHQERIDPFESTVLRLVGTTSQLQPLAARIIEEGVDPQDLVVAPGPKAVVTAASILIRAARPPFRFPDGTPLGPSLVWDIEHR